MSKINILDSAVYNRIAAGEVVESPVSIVKELVENSIDADAKSITIEIRGGGIEYIKVSDDGKGISKDDIALAFLPHATSKIKSVDDLDKIATLGFRGEALPSIASVAKVTLLSRIASEQMGGKIIYAFGVKELDIEIGAPLGTSVVVEGLFDKVPARKKFLARASTEASKISDFVQKLILANPKIAIKYFNEDKLIYNSIGTDLKQAIYTIYGDAIENLSYLESTMPDITLKGFISKPSYSKHSRNFQTLIVNGRIVENSDLAYCIYLCYQDFLVKRQYPLYVLNIDLPLDMVDVNVHPNKTIIKFSDFNRIKNFVMGSIKKSINAEIMGISNIFSEQSKKTEGVAQVTSDVLFNDMEVAATKNNFFKPISSTAVLQEAPNTRPSLTIKTPQFFDSITKQESYIKLDDPLSLINVGKLFNTYIVIQKNNSIYLIDQHAAHEKILYDKLIKSIDENQIIIQDLLIPYVFAVNNSESTLLNSYLEDFSKIGFIISPFGANNFSLSAIPSLCSGINLKDFVSILLDLLKTQNFKRSEFIKDSIMQSACKAAVKGADDLKKEEIEVLIKEIGDKNILFCPHGRPAVVEISKSEIEKWFKRTL